MHRFSGNPQRIPSYPTGRRRHRPLQSNIAPKGPSALGQAAEANASIHQEGIHMFSHLPITFPNLGIEINPSPVAFTVFGKDIYWYGIIIAAPSSCSPCFICSRGQGLRRHAERCARYDPLGGAHRCRLRTSYYYISIGNFTPIIPFPSSISGRAGLPSMAASSAAQLRCLSS